MQNGIILTWFSGCIIFYHILNKVINILYQQAMVISALIENYKYIYGIFHGLNLGLVKCH